MSNKNAAQLFNDAGKAAIERILSETKQTTAWLAGRIGVHQGTIDSVLRGTNPFSRVLLIKMADGTDAHPVELLTGSRFTDTEFRDLLDWFMCSDPWPVEGVDGVNKNARIGTMLDAEAKARGYGNWVTAYHDKALTGDGQEAS